jgi:hypothetical protein
VRIDGAIQPRLASGESEPSVHASDNLLVALMHGLIKACGEPPEGPSRSVQSCPSVRSGLYRLAQSFPIELRFCFFSLHRHIAAYVDPDQPIWLHMCPAESFALRHRGLVTFWTRGLVRSAAEWTTPHHVVPVTSVPLRLRDLPCAIALHRSGVGHVEAMWRYPFAEKLRWK